MLRVLSSVGRRPSRIAFAGLIAIFALTLAPGIAEAGTLDQGNDYANSGSEIVGACIVSCTYQSWAQTFTAGLTGDLDQVQLYLGAGTGGTNPLTVQIRNVNGTHVPGTTVLESASVAAASLPAAGGWVEVDFASPFAPVQAGTQYSIVAYATPSSDSYRWFAGTSYAGGQAFQSLAEPPLSWTAEPEDLAFNTFVRPIQHTLSVDKTGSGQGGVTSSPPGIDCGSNCSARFDEGTSLTLIAAPASGSTFTGWSGGGCSGTGPCQVTLSGDTTVRANFDSNTSGAGGGSAPNTKITKATISEKRHKARFRFAALGPHTGFQCELKRGHRKASFRRCTSPKTYKHLKSRRYTFKVRAKGPGGTDPSPAHKRFRIG